MCVPYSKSISSNSSNRGSMRGSGCVNDYVPCSQSVYIVVARVASVVVVRVVEVVRSGTCGGNNSSDGDSIRSQAKMLLQRCKRPSMTQLAAVGR